MPAARLVDMREQASLRIHHWLDIRMRYCIKFVEVELIVGTDVDIRALVLCAVTVLRGREYYGDVSARRSSEKRSRLTCYAFSVVLLLVTFHPDFVRTDDGVQTILVTEPLGNIRTELHAYTSLARSAPRGCLRISPEHFHHKTSLSGLSLLMPIQRADVVKCDLIVREQASMQNKVLGPD